MIYGLLLIVIILVLPQGSTAPSGTGGSAHEHPSGRGLSKRFSGVTAVDDVSFEVDEEHPRHHRAQRCWQDHGVQPHRGGDLGRLRPDLPRGRGDHRKAPARHCSSGNGSHLPAHAPVLLDERAGQRRHRRARRYWEPAHRARRCRDDHRDRRPWRVARLAHRGPAGGTQETRGSRDARPAAQVLLLDEVLAGLVPAERAPVLELLERLRTDEESLSSSSSTSWRR